MYLVVGKLKEVKEDWHEYLKDRELVLFNLFGQWSLMSIKNENGLGGLCEMIWENEKEHDYCSLEGWKEDVELGNAGFGFDYDEIEIILNCLESEE